MSDFTYVGGELELFAQAQNWKHYYRRLLAPYLRGDVLEVGAGLGATTQTLCAGNERSWLCLEPDPTLLARVQHSVATGVLPANCRAQQGTVANLDAGQQFDTILYIDVLEHIQDDAAEIRSAAGHLRPDGHLLVLSPAHPWLYTPFDQAIGHYRRYTRPMLRALTPPALRMERAYYLDAAGMVLSLGNRLLLRQAMPTARQIHFWDRRVIPISRVLDRLTGFNLGKTVICVWRKL